MMIFGVLDIKLNHLRLSQNSQLIRIETRHSNWITSIEVNEKLNKLISASTPFDQTLKIWNLSTGECLKILNEKGSHQIHIDLHDQQNVFYQFQKVIN